MNKDDKIMKSYYKERAPVYDRVYAYPERQDDLRFLEEYIANQFINLSVLEVAAGTGYWTQFIASKAKSIFATDATSEALEQINQRPLAKDVQTAVIDAFALDEIGKSFNGAFAGLWISHIPKQRLMEFLTVLHSCLNKDSTVVFLDNSSAQCQRLPISYTDRYGNTYQDRELDDNSVHRVLKNFPTESELVEATSKFGKNQKYIELENFWMFQYEAN